MTAVTLFVGATISSAAACIYGLHYERLRPFVFGFVGSIAFLVATIFAGFGAAF